VLRARRTGCEIVQAVHEEDEVEVAAVDTGRGLDSNAMLPGTPCSEATRGGGRDRSVA